MKKIVAALLVLVMALGMVACGGKGSKVEGVYQVTKMSMDGEEITAELDSMAITFEFKADGTCIMSMMGYDEEGTFTQDGSKISITIDGDTETGTVKGKTITISDGAGNEMVLEKK